MRNNRALVSSRGRRQIKQRRTFTLSPESIALLEELSASRGNSHAPESVSGVLEELLTHIREERRRQAIERAVGRYYDDRSPEQEEEEIAWGKFALSQFLVDDSSSERSK